MAGKKPSKNATASTKGSQKVNLVTSDVCEKCQGRCQAGEDYIKSLALGKVGKGVVCKK